MSFQAYLDTIEKKTGLTPSTWRTCSRESVNSMAPERGLKRSTFKLRMGE